MGRPLSISCGTALGGWGFGFRVSGSGIRVPGPGIKASGFRFWVPGFGFRGQLREIAPPRGASAPDPTAPEASSHPEREFFIDNLLVQIHFIIVMIRWTGLAPWEFEFPFQATHFTRVYR